MADPTKSQKLKLASSRKRFKELQELRKKKNVPQIVSETNVTDEPLQIDSLTNSTHSSLNTEVIEDENSKNSYSHPSEDTANLPFVAEKFSDNFVHSNVNQASDNLHLEDKTLNMFTPSQFQMSGLENNLFYKDITPNLSTNNLSQKEAQQTQTGETTVKNDNLEGEAKNTIKSHIFPTNKGNTESITKKENINNFFNQAGIEIVDSNIESLRQLSNQMTQYVDSEYSSFNSITDLEKRNLELISHLEQQKITTEQQNSLINDLRIRIAQVEKELEEKAEQSNTQLVSEVRKLKEDLQCHIQTIGMLVAEKTELSANLSQFELVSKQKSAECEELKGRLKTSRSRVADLEREIATLRSEKQQNKNITEEKLEYIDKLQQEYNIIKDKKEELLQDMLEIREKLKNTSEENITLQQQINELSSKLSLANIRIQQLSNESLPEGDLETLMRSKFELEKQVIELNQALKSVTKERDDSSAQYQLYAQQQNAQLINLSSKLEQLQQENENLSRQEQNRIKHISELERQLQNLQTDQVKFAVNKSSDIEITKELYLQLQIEKDSLEESYSSIASEKEVLLKELEAKNDLILELEDLVEQLRGNQPDSTKLLTMLESDKVAAAKAIQQNKELKQQLESMEEVFLKVNNDKIDLTEKLSKLTRDNKELLEKLQKTELHLQKLTDAIEIKDRELFNLQENFAKIQSVDNEHIPCMSHHEIKDNISGQSGETETEKLLIDVKNEVLQRDLTNEEERLKELNVTSFQNLGKELEMNLCDNCNDSQNSLNKEIAMTYLEDKFKRTMQEIADLLEEKQKLEHLVVQLQGETETIGEYIALYQQQRMVLKQKCLERDHELKQLTYDREQIKIKLERLIELIRKLNLDADITDEHTQLINKSNNDKDETKDVYTEFVDEILTLLSEIKSSNLIHPDENIHCSVCSGRLITV